MQHCYQPPAEMCSSLPGTPPHTAHTCCSSNAAFRHEWDGHIRNLRDGRLHSTICRGVVYNKDGSTSPQVVVSMVCAELEPSTGKTYL